jgi:excisionase family DNA binding protein
MIDFGIQERLLTAKEAAKLLRISIKTLRTCVRQGRIRSLNLGRQTYFSYEDLGAFMMNAYPMTPSVGIAA